MSRTSSGDPAAPGDLDLRHDAVAAEHPAHRLRPRPDADDPDRDALLHRPPDLGEVGAVAFVVVVAAVVLRPALPERPDQVDALVEVLGTHRQVDDLAGQRQVGRDRTEPDGENRPPRGQLIEGGDLARHLPGTPPGKRGEHGAEHHALGPGGHRRQQRPGVDAVAPPPTRTRRPSPDCSARIACSSCCVAVPPGSTTPNFMLSLRELF